MRHLQTCVQCCLIIHRKLGLSESEIRRRVEENKERKSMAESDLKDASKELAQVRGMC